MTPGGQIEVLEYDGVFHAHVGDIIETLKRSGRQHALVVDHSPMDDRQTIRGIFSASQIARQLGFPTSTFDLAGTFSDLDAELEKAASRHAVRSGLTYRNSDQRLPRFAQWQVASNRSLFCFYFLTEMLASSSSSG